MLSLQASSQVFNLRGRIIDRKEQGIEEAFLIFPESGEVMYTNDSGYFQCRLRSPAHHILIKKAGYISQKIYLPYHFNENMIITLDSADTGADFDADRIMRLAASRRRENEDRYTAYEASVYKRNVGYIYNIPFEIWRASGVILPSRSDSGVVFISEKKALFNYGDPDHFDEKVLYYQTAGRISIPGWHYIPDLDLSLYHQEVFLKNVSSVPYHSPLASSAGKHYYFTPIASFYEGERKVYRIGIKPRKKHSTSFTGTIEVYGDSYTISSVDLYLSDKNLLRIIDSFKLKEMYFYSDSAYRQARQDQEYHLDIFGFRCKYHVSTFFSNHRFKADETDLFDKQVVSMDSSAITFNNKLWDSIRPIELPEAERALQEEFPHSVCWINQEQQGVDPIYEPVRFRLTDLFEDGYDVDTKNSTTRIFPVWRGIGYNTVEGISLTYDLIHTRYFKDSEIMFQPEVRYGYPANTFYSRMKIHYFYDLDDPKMISLEGGHAISQFNKDQPILPQVSALYTLFLSRNYMKMYARDYLSASFKQEVMNGLEANAGLSYAYRYPLYNRTDFQITGDPEDFTPNNPDFPPVITSGGFDPHHALTLEASVAYQFNQQYKMINGRKVNIPTKDPRIYLNYFKGIPSPFSKTDYDHINVGMSFQFRFYRTGLSKFDINAGKFLQNRNVPFIDFRHFKGVQIFFLQPAPRLDNSIREFSTLPYYAYSTDNSYFEGHFEHNFEGLLLRPLKLHSFLGINYLSSLHRSQFLEFFVGVDNIFDAIRLEFAGGFDNFLEFKPSVRVGIDFDYRYYLDHRKKIPRSSQSQ